MTGSSSGILYGIGVGPGDPELMTLRAHRLISRAKVVAYPAPDSGDSFARRIAAAVIPAGAEEISMVVPLQANRFPAQKIYAEAAQKISAHLDRGTNVAVLCEGDPFFYGSFMYLFARLAGHFRAEIVPGVSSLSACAASLKRPLTARNDVLTVLPGPLPDAELRPRIEAAEAIAIMKVGRHLGRIRALLEQMGLTANSGYIEHASLDTEQVSPMTKAPETAPYFSMILIYKGDDPWLT